MPQSEAGVVEDGRDGRLEFRIDDLVVEELEVVLQGLPCCKVDGVNNENRRNVCESLPTITYAVALSLC